MAGQNKQKGLFRVAVYFSEQDLTAVVREAEKAGFRRVGTPIKTQKPHGFAGEWLANTDGVSRYLKACHVYFLAHEAERLQDAAAALARLKEAEREADKYAPLLGRAAPRPLLGQKEKPAEGGGVG